MAKTRSLFDEPAQNLTGRGAVSGTHSYPVNTSGFNLANFSAVSGTRDRRDPYNPKFAPTGVGTTTRAGSGSRHTEGATRYPFPGKWHQFRDRLFWTLQRGDLEVLKREIHLVPLRFRDTDIEKEFIQFLIPTFHMRCALVGVAALTSFTFFIPIYVILSYSTILSLSGTSSTLIVSSILLCGVFSSFIGIVPFVPYIKKTPEKATLTSLFFSWVFGTLLACVISLNIRYVESPIRAALSNIWRDVGTGAQWIWGVVIMDSILQTRSMLYHFWRMNIFFLQHV